MFHGGILGVGKQKRTYKGKVKQSRIITVYVDTGERYAPSEKYPEGRKKYKRVVRTLGSVNEVPKTQAEKAYKRELSKHKKIKHGYSPTLSDFARRYIEHKRYGEGKKSWETDQYSLKALISHFGPYMTLSEIDSKLIDEYKIERQAKVSPKTVNNELACLRNLYNVAAVWGEYEGINPVSRAGLIRKIPQKVRQGPTPEEEELLLKELPPSVAWIFTFALHTGMRISEIINLKTDQIKETQYFHEGKAIKIKIIALEPADTKTSQGRVIPLNSDAERVLNEALEFNAGRSKSVFLIKSRPYKPEVRRRKPRHGPVSEVRDGKPYSNRLPILKAMTRACKRLGIRRITPHDLRRGFASRMLAKGVDLISLRDVMGHVSFKMLERYITVDASKIRGVKLIESKQSRKAKKKSSL